MPKESPVWLLVLIPCVALVIALIAALIRPQNWLAIALVVGGVFPIYMLASGVIMQSNLWPIGGLIGAVMTMPTAFLGAGVGEMIGRRRRPCGPA